VGVAGEQAQCFEAFEDFLYVGLLGAIDGGADFVDGLWISPYQPLSGYSAKTV
jgi:hypothetical protein